MKINHSTHWRCPAFQSFPPFTDAQNYRYTDPEFRIPNAVLLPGWLLKETNNWPGDLPDC